MTSSSLALLGAAALGLATAAPAHAAGPIAQPSEAPLVIFVPVAVGFAPGPWFGPAPALAPEGVPVQRILAAEQADMNRLMADLQRLSELPLPAVAALPFPALPGSPFAAGPGTQLYEASLATSGRGVCSESITESFGRDGTPHVTVKRSGSDCGPLRFAPPGLAAPASGQPGASAPFETPARVYHVRYPASPQSARPHFREG